MQVKDNHVTIRARPCNAVLWATLIAISLAGCASPSMRQHSADADVKRHVDRGYIIDQRHATESARDTWTIGADAVDVSLMVPSGNGAYPLVVYLPGLGEPANAGIAWRRAWSEAGYAVLSVQPTSMGEKVWSSELARVGDFRTLAKDSFSAHSLVNRLTILNGVFAELSRRQGQADAGLFRRIDLTRIAVAGFDLGAQAAMAVAGEEVEGLNAPHWPKSVKTVIALSPYADFSGMGLESLFRPIHLPVLSVTSEEDADQYGLVTSAAVRRAPFQRMPAGQKYLLLLSAATHSLISGRETPAAGGKSERSGGGDKASQEGSDERPHARGGRSGGGGRGRGGERGSSSRVDPSANWAMQLANVQGITTAYLDATVKDDPVAREWLRKDARRWLGDAGELLSK